MTYAPYIETCFSSTGLLATKAVKKTKHHSLARQHQGEAIDLSDLLMRVQFVALEVAHVAHAHEHAPELPPGDAQWLEQSQVHLGTRERTGET